MHRNSVSELQDIPETSKSVPVLAAALARSFGRLYHVVYQ
jgi:hypothetical protein